jgi:hypothetical protein
VIVEAPSSVHWHRWRELRAYFGFHGTAVELRALLDQVPAACVMWCGDADFARVAALLDPEESLQVGVLTAAELFRF